MSTTEPIIREMRERLHRAAERWYIIDIAWASGRSDRYTTDLATIADCYVVSFRKHRERHPWADLRIFVTTTTQEPSRERAKREAWDAYLTDTAE